MVLVSGRRGDARDPAAFSTGSQNLSSELPGLTVRTETAMAK